MSLCRHSQKFYHDLWDYSADITGYMGTFKDLVGEYAQTMENDANNHRL